MQRHIHSLGAAGALITTACTLPPLPPAAEARESLFQCAKLAAVHLGFVNTEEPQRPNQFIASRRGLVIDVLMVEVFVRHDSALVNVLPFADDRHFPSEAAREAVDELKDACPDRLIHPDSTTGSPT